jgi:hypothetical protein
VCLFRVVVFFFLFFFFLLACDCHSHKEEAHGRQGDEGALMPIITAIFFKKNLLTPEVGQFRPKHVVF